LVKNVNATGLFKTIEELKDITIFAPTNTAFDNSASILSQLTTEKISNALTYHVVKGVQYSNGIRDGQILPTVQGGSLKVKINGGIVYINNAKVVKADVLTKNGVVHVIDAVLTP
jgi:transforming growth factor-beta-induced protein